MEGFKCTYYTNEGVEINHISKYSLNDIFAIEKEVSEKIDYKYGGRGVHTIVLLDGSNYAFTREGVPDYAYSPYFNRGRY